MERANGREAQQLRPWSFEPGFAPQAEGSVLVSSGDTRVLCAASVEERVPPWMNEPNRGWVKAEYAMLPCSTQYRTRRDTNRSNGRTHEIQRLIGRSLRAVTDLKQLGSRTLTLDCDVLNADAGTRTASISGAWVAMAIACASLRSRKKLDRFPFRDQVAAVSLGVVGEDVFLDLDYPEDVAAEVDLNLVMTASGGLVEVQGTAEGKPFSRQQLDQMIEVGWKGLEKIFDLQRQTLKACGIEFSL